MATVRIGISACLLGERTRYDGGHRLDPFLTETLGRYVRFVPVCPEVECGLGVPREPMQIEEAGGGTRLVTVETGRDLTPIMERTAARLLERLEEEAVWGFIFKARSPSCGPGVPVYGRPRRAKTKGIFFRLFEARFGLVPTVDEAGMRTVEGRAGFIGRMFVLGRWRKLAEKSTGREAVARFHGRHRLLLFALSEGRCREMDALLAGAEEGVGAAYLPLLLAATALKPTAAKHARALRHATRPLKGIWTDGERREAEESIAAFRAGLSPLMAPLVLLGHFARKYGVASLEEQYYLHPEAEEAMLLYHA